MPSVRPKPIASFLARKRKSPVTVVTSCSIFSTTQCDSPFVGNKQVKIIKPCFSINEEIETLASPMKRSYSVRSFKFSNNKNASFTKENCTSLKPMLNNSKFLSTFRQFLASEFSEENLDFWCQCERYKKEKMSKQRKMATKIYNTFVADESAREVNLDADTKASTLKSLQNPTSEIFDLAQDKIFKLMERDSFPRFLTCQTNFVSRQSKKLKTSASSSYLIDELDRSKLLRKLRRQSSL